MKIYFFRYVRLFLYNSPFHLLLGRIEWIACGQDDVSIQGKVQITFLMEYKEETQKDVRKGKPSPTGPSVMGLICN